MLINFKFQPRGSKGPDSPSFLKFGGVKVIHKFSDCGGGRYPSPPRSSRVNCLSDARGKTELRRRDMKDIKQTQVTFYSDLLQYRI